MKTRLKTYDSLECAQLILPIVAPSLPGPVHSNIANAQTWGYSVQTNDKTFCENEINNFRELEKRLSR